MGKHVLGVILGGMWLYLPVYAQVIVTVSPSPASVHVGGFQQFSAKVTGTTTTGVTWSVALPAGGTGAMGSISTGGRYTPPSVAPNPNTGVVTATSHPTAA